MKRQRLAVIRALAVTVDHADPSEILQRAWAKVPSISLSTVYRTMRVLDQR
jgi:Fur family transcriptional regulator, ferric uptake regulator